jgi:hypothetical protein
MIESGGLPNGRVMALSTRVRQSAGDVIRTRCRSKIGLVARIAVRRMRSILAVAVALHAGQVHVRARQGERGSGVIIRGGRPIRRRVTGLTGCRKTGG